MLIHALTKVIVVTPTLDTSIYASGDTLGSLMTLTGAANENGGTSVLQGITVVDKASQSVAIDFIFFTGDSVTPAAAPTITSADNAAISVTDTIMGLSCLGVASVLAANYSALALNSVATLLNIGLPLQASKGAKDLYCQMVVRSGTPTYTASDLFVKFGLLLD